MSIDARTVAVALAGFCAFIDLYATQSLLPLLAHDFNARPAEVSLTVSATTLAVAFIAPFTGIVADVLGRKRVITAAMFALVIPTVMVALAATLRQMILWRFVQGLLLPPIFAVTVAYVGEEWPAGRATAVTGFYTAAAGLGGFSGRFITGLVAAHVDWQAAFLVLAAVTLACAVGVAVLLPKEQRFVRSGSLLSSSRMMVQHLRNRQLVATFGIGFGVLFSFVAIFTYLNFHLAAPPFGLSTAALGSIFIVYLLGVVVTPQTGRLVDLLGRRGVVTAAIGVWILGLLLTLSGSLTVIIAGLAIGAAAGFVCQSVSTSHVALNARQARSAAVGLYVTAYYIGGSVGGIVPGLFWNRAGWPSCVALVIVVQLAIAATVLRFWREMEPQAKPER